MIIFIQKPAFHFDRQLQPWGEKSHITFDFHF